MKGSDTQVKKATRKIYLSIIFVTLSLLTMVATTFAWVGIVSNASFERLTINLETDNEKSDYGIMLSLTGKEGDFHDTIEPVEVQKQILRNMGVEEKKLSDNSSVQSIFSTIKLSQCTTIKDWDDNGSGECHYLDPFTDLYGNDPCATMLGKQTNYKGYIEFDIWVAIYKIGEDDYSSDNKLSIYLRNSDSGGLFSSDTSSCYIPNQITFPDQSNPLSTQYLTAANNFVPGTQIKGYVSMKPSNAVRLAVQKAKAVDLYDETNTKNYQYNGLVIYKDGSDLPNYDSKYNLHDFGGVMPTDFNFARLHYNSTHPVNEKLGEVPSQALKEKRGDITFVDDGVSNHVVDETDSVTTSSMIKLHFSFWFEGWDADCYEAINDQPVSVSLNFSTKNPNEA